jgi:hypothetical protein
MNSHFTQPTTMKRLLILLLVLAATGLAYAHNGMTHVMGTIAAMSATSVDVKATNGKTTTVVVNDSTKWLKGLDAVNPTDAKLGDRVVIHAKPVDGKLIAAEVQIAIPKKK